MTPDPEVLRQLGVCGLFTCIASECGISLLVLGAGDLDGLAWLCGIHLLSFPRSSYHRLWASHCSFSHDGFALTHLHRFIEIDLLLIELLDALHTGALMTRHRLYTV